MSIGKIAGIILLIAGAYLCFLGNVRRNSLVGSVANASTNVANKVDGKERVTNATWYFVGGGVLVVVGLSSLLRRRAS